MVDTDERAHTAEPNGILYVFGAINMAEEYMARVHAQLLQSQDLLHAHRSPVTVGADRDPRFQVYPRRRLNGPGLKGGDLLEAGPQLDHAGANAGTVQAILDLIHQNVI